MVNSRVTFIQILIYNIKTMYIVPGHRTSRLSHWTRHHTTTIITGTIRTAKGAVVRNTALVKIHTGAVGQYTGNAAHRSRCSILY